MKRVILSPALEIDPERRREIREAVAKACETRPPGKKYARKTGLVVSAAAAARKKQPNMMKAK